MINSRFSQNTKFSASFKNKVNKREFERFKKMIKNKTFMNSRSSCRDFENVEMMSKFVHFVIDSKSLIIFAFFVTFMLTFFVIVLSIFFITFIFAFFVTFFFVFAFLDESIVNLIFEEMNRDVLIRFFNDFNFFFR
jgi:hypothetical protein